MKHTCIEFFVMKIFNFYNLEKFSILYVCVCFHNDLVKDIVIYVQ